MKNFNRLLFLLLCFGLSLLQGCIKDRCSTRFQYTYYEAVYKTAAEVRANIRSNPPQPIERPGKIYIRGSYIFLNEIDRGIHVIDNSNPAAPVAKAFIDIPGNMDMAVKNETLYADLYTDLVALDITDPMQVRVHRIIDGVFPQRSWGTGRFDSTRIIAGWVRRDTTVTEDCDGRARASLEARSGVFMNYSAAGSSGKSGAVSPYGVGGSMARFALAKERLYTVDNNQLRTFNVTQDAAPVFVRSTSLGWGIETIFPYKNNLFIGSTTGMFVYGLANPDAPQQAGRFAHVLSCDPVVADDTHAYVTLRSGTLCRGNTNQLDVLNLGTLPTPTLVKTYPLSNPHGLAKDGNILLVCDGKEGLKIFNAANPGNLQFLSTVSGIEAQDVIAWNGWALVVAKGGLFQFDYQNPAQPVLLSKITVKN